MPGSRLHITSSEKLKDCSDAILCLLAVNQENEPVIKQKLENMYDAKIEYVFLFSPNDIWRELDRVKQCANL